MSDSYSETAEGMDVAYVAHLARLHLTEEEIAQFQDQLGQVLQYIRALEELEVEGIEPTAHAVPVEKLRRRELVEGHRPEKDRRRQVWRLTENGRQLLASLLPDLQQWAANLVADGGQEKVARLAECLETLVQGTDSAAPILSLPHDNDSDNAPRAKRGAA